MQKRGIVVLGISADDISSHQKFAEKFGLPFPLLADTYKTVIQAYGVWKEKNNYGKKYMDIYCETFLIDKDGVIRKIWHRVSPETHADDVLAAVEKLGL